MTGRGQLQKALAEPCITQGIRSLIHSNPGLHRAQLADQVCAQFGWWMSGDASSVMGV